MTPRLLLTLLVPCALSGCALTATIGPSNSWRSDHAVTMSTGLSTHVFRNSGPTLGVRMHQVIDHAVHIRSMVVHGGYDWRIWPGRLALEVGGDLGGGSPLRIDDPGSGAYGGFAGMARLRLLGADDSELTYNLAAPSIELVLVPRVGAFMPPERSGRSALVAEYGFEVGLRLTVASDAVGRSQGRIREAVSPGKRAKEGTP